MNSLIAAKLNVLETAIVRIEEWTHVLFVVVKGLGARFVSKKVVEVKKMTRLNMYQLSVSNGTLGSPAQNTDVTNGFFKWSIYGRTHSCKSETTHIDSLATLIIDDSIWGIYEGKTGDPCLENRSSGDQINMTSDLVIEPRSRTVTIVSSGCINEHPLGLQFVEHLEGSVDIKTYLAT